jgi:hypothetical protein
MRMKFLSAATCAVAMVAACTQAAAPAADDMGPMPVVAGLYDSGPLSSDAEYLSVWFTEEMADAIAANAAGPEAERVDFDYRSWANDSEVDDIRYAVGQHAEPSHAEISTRFTYPGIGGGMNLTWDMCRRADGQWRIANVTAIAVSGDPAAAAVEEASLRPMLGLDPVPPETCV